MSTAKRIAIIVGTVLVVLGVAAVIAIDVVNRRAEQEIASSLESSLARSGMEDAFTYGDIDVRSPTGTIEVRDLVVESPGSGPQLRAAIFAFTASPLELVGILRDPQNATLTQATFRGVDVAISNGPGAGGVTLADLDLTVEGALGGDIGPSPRAVLSRLTAMQISATGMSVTPDSTTMARISALSADNSPLVDEENWTVDVMEIDARIAGQTVLIDSMDVVAPLVSFSTTAIVNLDESMRPVPESGELSIVEVDPAVREMASGIGTMFGLEVPEEGSFVLSFSLGPDGFPRLEIQ